MNDSNLVFGTYLPQELLDKIFRQISTRDLMSGAARASRGFRLQVQTEINRRREGQLDLECELDDIIGNMWTFFDSPMDRNTLLRFLNANASPMKSSLEDVQVSSNVLTISTPKVSNQVQYGVQRWVIPIDALDENSERMSHLVRLGAWPALYWQSDCDNQLKHPAEARRHVYQSICSFVKRYEEGICRSELLETRHLLPKLQILKQLDESIARISTNNWVWTLDDFPDVPEKPLLKVSMWLDTLPIRTHCPNGTSDESRLIANILQECIDMLDIRRFNQIKISRGEVVTTKKFAKNLFECWFSLVRAQLEEVGSQIMDFQQALLEVQCVKCGFNEHLVASLRL